jgi:peroxiredoxin
MIEIRDLRTDVPAPNFRLQATNGREIELVKYRGRQPIVLFLLDDLACENCEDRLKAFAEAYPEFEAEKVALLVIVPGDIEGAKALKDRLSLPFPLLADSDNTARQKYLGDNSAGQFILDRYTVPQIQESGADCKALMSVADALNWAVFSDTTCAGCA